MDYCQCDRETYLSAQKEYYSNREENYENECEFRNSLYEDEIEDEIDE